MSREVQEFARRNDRSRRNLRMLFVIIMMFVVMPLAYDAFGVGFTSSLIAGIACYAGIIVWWSR